VRVAVTVGIAQDAAVLANADKVHTPGVNADAGQLDAFFGHRLQAADNLIVQGINVPKEVSALLDDGVGKACHLALGELSVLNGTQYGAAACCAKVYGQKKTCFVHGGLKKLDDLSYLCGKDMIFFEKNT
jgi:hypothetical protein